VAAGKYMSLSVKQKGVLKGMAFGVLAAIILIAGGITLNPFDYTENVTHSDRISIAVQSGILIAFCLAISIARLAKHRFFSPEDIDGGGLTEGSSKTKVLQSLLQNTVEQSILAILVYMAWAVIMPASWLSVIPLAAFAFVIGRMLFFTGYRNGAPSRAFGFTLSFYPSVGMLLCIAVMAIWTQIN
jgi:hypothetical protein